MDAGLYVILLIVVALVCANLPWFSNNYFFFIPPRSGKKSSFLFVLEWMFMYLLVAAIAVLIESKVQGTIQPKKWEFYVTTICLFAVFALPGFIYKYELSRKKKRG